VKVSGTSKGVSLAGDGYVELTGNANSFQRCVLKPFNSLCLVMNYEFHILSRIYSPYGASNPTYHGSFFLTRTNDLTGELF
jgi:hypothetical protein